MGNTKATLKTTFLLIVLMANLFSSDQTISLDDSRLQWVGRIDHRVPTEPVLWWSASELRLRFEGSALELTLEDERGRNYFNVFLDGESVPTHVLSCRQGSQTLTLVSNVPAGPHTLSFFKRTEASDGKTIFKNLKIYNGKLLQAPEAPKRKLLFFGDSIVSAMGIEDLSRQSNKNPALKNAWHSYACLTARNLGADVQLISRSGIGINISYFDQVMPEIFNRISPSDLEVSVEVTNFHPDLVEVNLMDNDSEVLNRTNLPFYTKRFPSGVPDGKNLIEGYEKFILQLISLYPGVPLVCSLGPMSAVEEGSPFPDYVRRAVEHLKGKGLPVHFLLYPHKKTKGHPVISEHQEMAELLIPEIKKILSW